MGLDPSLLATATPAQCPGRAKVTRCPEPLCLTDGVTVSPGKCLALPQRTLPLLHRSYGLMRQTSSLSSTSDLLLRRVFAGYRPSRPGEGPSRRYLCGSLPGCLDPYRGGVSSAHARFFLDTIGLPQILLGRLPATTRSATSERKALSRWLSFLYLFRPPGWLATQVAPTAMSVTPVPSAPVP